MPGGASVPAGAHALVRRLEQRVWVVLGERVEDVHQVAATLGVEGLLRADDPLAKAPFVAGRAPFVTVAVALLGSPS